jgi:hypothetical protein
VIQIDLAQMTHIRLNLLPSRLVKGLDKAVVYGSCKADRSTIWYQPTGNFHTFDIAAWSWHQWLQRV